MFATMAPEGKRICATGRRDHISRIPLCSNKCRWRNFLPLPVSFLLSAPCVAFTQSTICSPRVDDPCEVFLSPLAPISNSKKRPRGTESVLGERRNGGCSHNFMQEALLLQAEQLMKDKQKGRPISPESSKSRLPDDQKNGESINRRIFIGSTLFAIGSAAQPNGIDAATAKMTADQSSALQWEASPINKRYGVTLYDAEKSGFNVRFITYLSRFLISYDEDCQRWWIARAGEIPRAATSDQVDSFRLKQFAAFSASVEVGLQAFPRPDGPRVLMDSLLRRYCPEMGSLERAREVKGLPPLNPSEKVKLEREIKEARRQIALLFGLMQKYQPVEEITTLLAAIDNATVTSVVVKDPGSGYAPGYGSPLVTFTPPEAGSDFEPASGRAILRPSGKILRIDICERGQGYSKPPAVKISPPASAESDPSASQATAKAFIFRQGENKGRLERIDLTSTGRGYGKNETISVEISSPEALAKDGGVTAKAIAVPELEVGEIKIVSGGSGYAEERPLQVYIEPPPLTARYNMNDPMTVGLASLNQTLLMSGPGEPTRSATEQRKAIYRGRAGGGGCIGQGCYDRAVVAIAYPTAKKDIFRGEDADAENRISPARKVSGTSIDSGDDSGMPSIPFWGGGTSSSSQLLGLIPSGIGLEFDSKLKRYILAAEEDFAYSRALSMREKTLRPLDPEFGPRGRSPIEREKQLDLSTFLRFSASGAICCSGVHLLLTPIDVVKTKVQTNPEKYPGLVSALRTVSTEEGFQSFFTGWAPTFLGFFVNGATGYSTTEFFRRYFTDLAGPSTNSLEVPIILAAASIAAFFGSFTLAPFEAVRVRSVAQPDYADNIVGVFNRMVDEEGVLSLFSAVPAFLPKEILFACAKFTVFDLSTQWLYDSFPAAREDLQLSLLVSLAGGTLGGISAAIVSNPADATISEMKKAKTDMGPAEAVKALLDKGGIPFLFRGLGIRMAFYTLIVSLQFLVYDAVRYSLGIGSDDLKLYLDVLGGALRQTGGPV